MFQSLELKHPRFYQIFRLFHRRICIYTIRMESPMLCQDRRTVSKRVLRSIPASPEHWNKISAHKRAFCSIQHWTESISHIHIIQIYRQKIYPLFDHSHSSVEYICGYSAIICIH